MSSMRMKMTLAADAVITLICLWGLYSGAQRGRLPIGLHQQGEQLVLTESLDGIAAGAVLLAVNGREVRNIAELEFYLDRLRRGDEVGLDFRQDDRIIRISRTLQPAYTFRYLAVVVICGSLYMLLAFVVIGKQQSRAAYVLHWLFIAIAVMYFLPWGPHAVFIHYLYLFAYAAVPFLFLYLTFLFPREKSALRTPVLAVAGGVLTLLLLMMAVAYGRAEYAASAQEYRHFMQIFNVFRFFFSLILLCAVAHFIHSYRTAESEPERRKLRWVLLGILIGPIALVMLWTGPQIILGRGLIPEEFVLLIVSSVPITFAISIVRYHILDIDLIFNRSLVYAIILGILLLIYALVVGVVAVVVGTITVRTSLLASAGAAILVALLLQPLRIKIQTFVDRTFFRVQYDYRETHARFAEKLKTCPSVQEAASCLLSQLASILLPEGIELALFDDQGTLQPALQQEELRPAWQQYYPELKLNFSESREVIAASTHVEPGVRHVRLDSPDLEQAGLVLICPLRTVEALGFLLLGRKKSGLPYFLEDVDLLQATAAETALTIDRLRIQEKWLLEHQEARKLEELNRAQSHFVSSVTHELKTPLTSIKMFAEMLRTSNEISEEKRGEYLDIIEGEIDRLNRLINTVLDFAQIERGVKKYHPAPLELNALVREVLDTFQYQFKMLGFTVETSLSPQRLPVHADRDALIEALSNLIANAMKYSGASRWIKISTKVQGKMAEVTVWDRGIGISADELQTIFEPFYRSADADVQRAGGAGLGLALVKHVMEAHGGTVSVESEPGKGSRFTLHLPLTEDSHETNPDH